MFKNIIIIALLIIKLFGNLYEFHIGKSKNNVSTYWVVYSCVQDFNGLEFTILIDDNAVLHRGNIRQHASASSGGYFWGAYVRVVRPVTHGFFGHSIRYFHI